jgi:MFS transporter, NNP family, nitrate/nitrite transporter
MQADLIKQHGLKATPTRGLTGATIGFFVGFAAVVLFGVTAKELRDIMGLSGWHLGLLISAPALTGSLLRIPFGAWVDSGGGRKPMIILLLLSCLGMFSLTLLLLMRYPAQLYIHHYWLFVVLGLFAGCGIATFSVGIPQTSYWFDRKKQGAALGTYAGLGNMAPGIFTILLAFMLPITGLPNAYVLWLIFLVVGIVLYIWVSRDAYYFQLRKKGVPREEAIEIAKQLNQPLIPAGHVMQALKISAGLVRLWALVLLYFVSFGGFLALTAWFPTYWRIFHHLPVYAAGLVGGAGFALLASVVRIYGGRISDKVGGEKIALYSFMIVFVGAVVLVFAFSFWWALIGELLIAIGMGVANAAVFKLVAKYVPHAIGGAAGWVGGLGAFGGFVVPPILGVCVDHLGEIGYARGFIVYVALALIGMLVSFSLVRLYGQKQPMA